MNYIDACLFLRSFYKRLDLWHGCLKEDIFFLHMPKCGGTSISQAISQRYSQGYCAVLNGGACVKATRTITQLVSIEPADPVFMLSRLKFIENVSLYFMHQKKTRLVSGHCRFSEAMYREFHNRYRFVTVLRDPVKRWISAYFYYRYADKQHTISSEVRAYLQSQAGQLEGCSYVIFLGGGIGDDTDYSGYSSRESIDRAKSNIDKLDLVGCLEYLEPFKKQFEKRFGVRLSIKKRNKNPKPRSFRDDVITEKVKEEIREICKPDVEIYQYVLEKFVKPHL